MSNNNIKQYTKNVLDNMPSDWLALTTHRLDIYQEEQAKTQFLAQLEALYQTNNFDASALETLCTAYDYIRLGHPLSCVLEWLIADTYNVKPDQVISFSSKITPILSVLRKNLLTSKTTQILYTGAKPSFFDAETIRAVYNYEFELKVVENIESISKFDGSTLFISQQGDIDKFELHPNIDFVVSVDNKYGSILLVNGDHNRSYISEIQHVRRRETIAMTPINCLQVLKKITDSDYVPIQNENKEANKKQVETLIKDITGADTQALMGSSGLSIQYAIMMGLVEHANENHSEKPIRFIVPPNCYGGTNDQARRVAACIENVEIVDLPVDAGQEMDQSVDKILDRMADEDAVPYIIAEIPTNPRVEVPDLIKLQNALAKERKTKSGELAVAPVFILDQTFCPNVLFLGEGKLLGKGKTIAYASGSKFPSGGKCTAGYCVGNKHTAELMDKVEKHLVLCDNEATDLQLEILANQLPSMNERIAGAYENTRKFVSFIQETLPEAKINFVSEELAQQGFTPSVFSLDLPTKGSTEEEKEANKRALNLKLIHLMIDKIPEESKFCVSYGQLKGCYWTVPATSTQGTTKEGDKDYIVRAALSANMDLDLHKKVFAEFVAGI